MLTPWPWNGPPMIWPLKSVTRHRPLQPMALTSTPFDGGVGGAPGIIISMEASQVPTSSFRTACSGPGVGGGGACAAAIAGASDTASQHQQTRDGSDHGSSFKRAERA